MDEKIRNQVQIPAYHAKWGKIWAHLKGRALSTLMGDAFQVSVETNIDEIKLMLADRAKDLGISPEELEERIVNDNYGNK